MLAGWRLVSLLRRPLVLGSPICRIGAWVSIVCVLSWCVVVGVGVIVGVVVVVVALPPLRSLLAGDLMVLDGLRSLVICRLELLKHRFLGKHG